MSTSPTGQQPTALSRNPSRNSTLSPSAHTVEMKDVSLATPEEDKNVEVPGAAAQPAAAGPAAVAGPGGAVPLIQLSKAKFALVFGSMMLAVFLYSLDQLIVSTAIPFIVSEFDSLSQVAWISNGFFMTLAGFSLLFSQLLAIFPSKWVFISSIFIFEIGSLLCGVAPSMVVLILGRCVAGIGGSGVFASAFQSIIEITTLKERAALMGLFGAVFGVSSVLGPLVGGAFTDHVSWRWCFYINLPIGGLSMFLIFLFFEARPALGSAQDKRPLWKKILFLDWVAVAIIMCFTTIVCLAFQYGGVQRDWNSGSVIALLVLIPVSFGVLIAWTHFIGPERAMIQLRFFKRRTIIAACGVGFGGWGTMMVAVQMLAIQYQAVDGRTATGSGIDLLSFICVQVVFMIVMGKTVATLGRYKPFIIAGPPLLILTSGLLYWSIKESKPKSYLMGFQAIYGAAIAMFLQQINVAVQVDFRSEPKDISRALGLCNFIGFCGRIFGISISTSILNNLLRVNVPKYAPSLDPTLVATVRESVTSIRKVVPEDLQPGVIYAYRQALAPCFLFGLALSVVACVFSFFIKDGSTHADEKDSNAAKTDVEKAAAPAEAKA